MNAWTDARIDDFMERYAQDRADTKAQMTRIEQKLDARRWSPALFVALLGPMGVAIITGVFMVLSRGGS